MSLVLERQRRNVRSVYARAEGGSRAGDGGDQTPGQGGGQSHQRGPDADSEGLECSGVGNTAVEDDQLMEEPLDQSFQKESFQDSFSVSEKAVAEGSSSASVNVMPRKVGRPRKERPSEEGSASGEKSTPRNVGRPRKERPSEESNTPGQSTPRKVGRPRKERPSEESNTGQKSTPRKVGRPRKVDRPSEDGTPMMVDRPSEDGTPMVNRPSEEGTPVVNRPSEESTSTTVDRPSEDDTPRNMDRPSEEGTPREVDRPMKEMQAQEGIPREVGQPGKGDGPSQEGAPRKVDIPFEESKSSAQRRKVGRPRKVVRVSEENDTPGQEGTPRKVGRPSEEGNAPSEDGTPRKVGGPSEEGNAPSQEGTRRKRGRPRKLDRPSEESGTPGQEATPRKRGRPRKVVPPDQVSTPRKRGRPRKVHQPSSDSKSLVSQESVASSDIAILLQRGSEYGNNDCEENQSVTKQKPYVCGVCQRRYISSESLKRHSELCGVEGAQSSKPKCEVCGKVFLSKTTLATHRVVHAEVRPFPCHLCDKSYTHQKFLDYHMMLHTGERPFVCEVCNKTYRRHFDLKQHKRIHTGETPFACKVCGQGLMTRLQLKAHMLIHDDVKPHKCDKCPKAFLKFVDLKQHKRLEHPELRPFKCNLCRERFFTRDELKSHKLTHPKSSSGRVCEVCGKHLVAHTLKVHMMTHTGERPFVCEVCNRGFIKRCEWVVHMRTHTGERPFICSMCGTGFITNTDLRRHVNSIHYQLRPFTCDICSKPFMYSQTLKAHKKLHMGIKNHKCTHCDKRYATKGSLNIHMRTHTGEKPFACSYCSMRFIDVWSKNRHVRLHTGEKPYKCLQCGAQFTRIEPYNHHQETVHKDGSGKSSGRPARRSRVVELTPNVASAARHSALSSQPDHTGSDPVSTGQAVQAFEVNTPEGKPHTLMVVQPVETYYNADSCPTFDIPSAPTVVVNSTGDPASSHTTGHTQDVLYVSEANIVCEPVSMYYPSGSGVVEYSAVEQADSTQPHTSQREGGSMEAHPQDDHLRGVLEVEVRSHRQGVAPEVGEVTMAESASCSQSAGGQETQHGPDQMAASPQDMEVDYVESDTMEDDLNNAEEEEERGEKEQCVTVAEDQSSDKDDGVLMVVPEIHSGHSPSGHNTTDPAVGSEQGKKAMTLTVLGSQTDSYHIDDATSITIIKSQTNLPTNYVEVYEDDGEGNLTLLDSSAVLNPSTSALNEAETVASQGMVQLQDIGAVETATSQDVGSGKKPTKEDKPVMVKSDPGSAPSGNQIQNIKEKASDLKIDVSVVEEVLKKRKMVFGKVKPEHICEVCGKGYTQSSSLRTHLAVVHNTVGCKASYPCDICNKACPSRSMLEAHQRSHTGARPFPCDLCGKTYKHKADLRHHITKYHFGSKPFVCDVCGNCFTEKGSLNAHKLLHEGSKPYKCTTCGKAFTQSSTLKTHSRIHTGEKPYICQYCGKCFTDRGSVSKHRRKHTGEKPYLCELCSCTFARSEQLKKHMSKDHSGEFQNLQVVADAVASIK